MLCAPYRQSTVNSITRQMTVTALVLTLADSGCILGTKKFDFSEKSNLSTDQPTLTMLKTTWADSESRPLE